MTVVGTLEAELKADPRQWEAAMAKAIEAMDRLSRRVDAASSSAAASLQKLQGSAKDLGERLSKVGAVTSGMGAAFGSAVPQMQGAIAAASGLAQVFASGGGVLAGIALAGTLVGALVSHFRSLQEESDKAAAAMRKLADEQKAAANSAVSSLADQERLIRLLERQALASPDSRDAIKVDEDIKNATAELAKRRGVLAGIRAEMELITAEAQKLGTLEAAQAGYTGQALADGVKVLSEQQQITMDTLKERERDAQREIAAQEKTISNLGYIAGLQKSIADTSKTTADNAERAAAAQEKAAALIRRIDTDRMVFELDKELGAPPQVQAPLVSNDPDVQAEYEDGLRKLYGAGVDVISQTVKESSLSEVLEDSLRAFEVEADARKDLIAALREEEKEAEKAAKKQAELAANAIGSIGSGTVGSFALATGGAVAGAALGGAQGAAVGQALGGLLGPMADNLMASMGVLDPLMQSLSRVVSGLSPAFALLGAILDATVVPVLDILAPVVLAVTQAVSLFSVPMLRVAQLIMPYFMAQLAILVPVIELVSDVFMALVGFIDTYVFLPIAKVVTDLYNAVVDVINGLISGLNGFLVGLGIQGIALSTLSRMSTPQSLLDMGIAGQELTDSIDDNTDALRDFSKSLTNLPAGYRYALTEYASETPNGSGVGRRDMARGGALIINGNVNVMARDANVLEAIRRNMRERGVPFGGPIASAPPKRN